MKLRVNVNGQDYDVEVDILEESGSARPLASVRQPVAAPPPRAVATAPAPAAAPAKTSAPAAAPTGKTLNSPIPGTVVEIKVKPGQAVAAGEVVMIIDAMKMNTPIPATQAATIKAVLVAVGNPVKMGNALIEFE